VILQTSRAAFNTLHEAHPGKEETRSGHMGGPGRVQKHQSPRGVTCERESMPSWILLKSSGITSATAPIQGMWLVYSRREGKGVASQLSGVEQVYVLKGMNICLDHLSPAGDGQSCWTRALLHWMFLIWDGNGFCSTEFPGSYPGGGVFHVDNLSMIFKPAGYKYHVRDLSNRPRSIVDVYRTPSSRKDTRHGKHGL
jgi:hypothetical protein